MTTDHLKTTSYFERLLGIDYFDGPVEGVGILPDKSACYFKLVAWDQDHCERVFATAEIPTHTADALWEAFCAVEPPRFPEWYPQSVGTDDISEKVRSAISAVRAESERVGITGLLQSQNLIGSTIRVKLDATQARAILRMYSDNNVIELQAVPIVQELVRTLQHDPEHDG